MRHLLDALTVKLDATPVSAKLYRRRRSAVFNTLSYAVERDLISDNPIRRVTHSVSKAVEQVGPGVVVNPRQAEELLTCVSYSGLRDLNRGARLTAFFATMYYAAVRPAEAMALRGVDCPAGLGLGRDRAR
jgi:integrase